MEVVPNDYRQWITRVVIETTRGEDREAMAIRLLAYAFALPESKVWGDIERERVSQEQLG